MIKTLKTTTAISFMGGNHRTNCEVPAECPICRVLSHCKQIPQSAVVEAQKTFSAPFICGNIDCGKVFVCYYTEHGVIYNFAPNIPEAPYITEAAIQESLDFKRIYTQAHYALGIGLKDIAGVGMRKALEFLIKDHVKKLKPESEDDVLKSTLGSVIENYIDNQKLKEVAKRAVWLANDQTHYVQKWNDKDIHDMVGLINLTMTWMEMERQTADIMQSMPKGK